MVTVINGDLLQKHNVGKYNFKVIALGSESENTKPKEMESEYTPEDHPAQRATDHVDSSALSDSSKESLIESLMQKTDEMSSNFIKLQMKLESKEEEFAEALKRAKEEAFAEGIEAGKAQAQNELNEQVQNSLGLYETSVEKLEKSAGEFEVALQNIKDDLVNAALDISKEVIQVELSENSAEVAKVLSEGLIKELQSASKITLKVNPKDHAVLSEHFGKLEHVDILSDSAVSEGGVIVISDAGNIDAQISKRFERVKKVVLSE